MLTFAGTEFTITAGSLAAGASVDSVALASDGAAADAAYRAEGYPITASGAQGTDLENYEITYLPGTLTIARLPLTITATDKTKAYGEEVAFEGTEFTVSGGTLLQGDSVDSVTLASEGASAGAAYKEGGYPITASDAQGTGLDKYDITYVDGTLTITKRELLITANDATKAYGEVLAFTGGTNEFTVVGDLQNGEEVTSVTITSEKASDPGTEAGEYADAIVPFYEVTGIDTNNYDIVFSNGTLTVTQAVLTITVNDATWKVGKPRPEYSFADFSSQLKAEDAVADITGGDGLATDVAYTNVVWGASEPTRADVKTYEDEIWLDPASLGGGKAANYAITIEPGDLTVLSADPILTASVSASVNWDTGLLDLELAVSNVGDGEVDPESDYWVQLKPGEAANGEIASVERTFYLDSPTGTLSNGCDYVDLTAQVRAALRSAGNGNEVFDPGETVTLTGVRVYHWKRWSPEAFLDANAFFAAGRLEEQGSKLRAQKSKADEQETVEDEQEEGGARVQEDVAEMPGEELQTESETLDAPATQDVATLGDFRASSAATYAGWLRDDSGKLVALLKVKTTKVKKAGARARSVITVTPFDGSRKRTYRTSVLPGGNPTDEFGVTYGDLGLGGELDGYTVLAGRDLSKVKADALKGMYSGVPEGVWTLAFAEASGYAALSVSVAKKGKAKVSGMRPDGKKVSISAQGVLVDGKAFAVPVMNAKKGIAFVVWIDGAGNLTVSDIAVDGWSFVESARLQNRTWQAKGLKLAVSSSEVSNFRVSYNARTGLAKGTFTFSQTEAGQTVSDTAKLSGVVVSDRLYATGAARKLGTFKVTAEK